MAEASKADYLALRSRLDKDGGPAFPAEHYETEHGDQVFVTGGHSGMSLRDWFAGQALVAVMHLGLESAKAGQLKEDIAEAELAKGAYALADAMLAHRHKESGS